MAALKVGRTGKVVGIDMTDEQRAMARAARPQTAFPTWAIERG